MIKTRDVVQLTESEHVLKRSKRYLGNTELTNVYRWILEEDNIILKDVIFVPALLKLIRETLDNCIDVYIDTKGKFANKIDIEITNDVISIKDNGTGIPIKKALDSQGNELDELMPTLAWCSLRSGGNFDDKEDNETQGQNGEGVSLVNIWSTYFKGETADGSKYYVIECKDNLSSRDYSIKESKQRYTKVTFKPDLNRMGIDTISDIYIDLLKYDLMFLKLTFEGIKFTLNGVKI